MAAGVRKMKHLLIFVLLVSSAAFGAVKETSHMPLELLRQQAGEDPNTTIGSSAISDANSDFWDKPTDANGLFTIARLGKQESGCYQVGIIAAAGHATDPNNKTFTVNLYAWRAENGPRQLICSVDYVVGELAMCRYPCAMPDAGIKRKEAADGIYWADTATLTSYWYTSRTAVADSGNNRIAVVLVTLYGESHLYAEVVSADGSTGTEATDVSLYVFRVSG
jgi:hypothetical protein